VALVFSSVVDGDGADATAGYTYTRDLGAAVAGTPTAHSNEGLVMYLAPGFLADQQAELLATAAHELEHVINASNKILGGRTAVRSEASWLDEALAMYAMQANGYGMGYLFMAYLAGRFGPSLVTELARFRYAGVGVPACQADALAGPEARGLAMLPWAMRCLDVSAGSLGLQAAPGVAAELLAP
jgi:hypothetical protein